MNAESREIVLSDPDHIEAACCTLVLPAALNASAEFIGRRIARGGSSKAIVMAVDTDGYLELRETLIAHIESTPLDDRPRQDGESRKACVSLPSLDGADLIAGGCAGGARRLYEMDAAAVGCMPALVDAMAARDVLLLACRDEHECLVHALGMARLARIVVHAAAEDAELRVRLQAMLAAQEAGAS